jgi:hypothetical protein
VQDERPTPADQQPSRRGRRGWWLVAGLLLLPPVGCAGCVAAMPDRAAEADIRAAGGTLQRDTLSPALTIALDNWVLTYGPVFLVSYRGPVTKDKLEPLTRLTDLRDLTLINAAGSDRATWPLLAELPTLRVFTAIATDVRDAELTHLAGLPALRRVNLWQNPHLTPAGVGRLRRVRPDVHINFE